MTEPIFEHPWEKRLHEELRQLPELTAPATLLPNVMAAIRARESRVLAWYRRPATTWPPAWRIALGVAALGLFALLVAGVQLLWPGLPAWIDSPLLSRIANTVSLVWSTTATLVDAFSLVVRDSLSPVLLAIAGGACLSYLILFGAGSALWRAAMRPRTA